VSADRRLARVIPALDEKLSYVPLKFRLITVARLRGTIIVKPNNRHNAR